MEREIETVAYLDVPLTESVSRIHEFGLRRRLASPVISEVKRCPASRPLSILIVEPEFLASS